MAYHLNEATGNPNKCSKKSCHLPHFESKEEALASSTPPAEASPETSTPTHSTHENAAVGSVTPDEVTDLIDEGLTPADLSEAATVHAVSPQGLEDEGMPDFAQKENCPPAVEEEENNALVAQLKAQLELAKLVKKKHVKKVKAALRATQKELAKRTPNHPLLKKAKRALKR